MNESLLFSDGACSGNPGPGGYGAIAVLNGTIVKELGGASPSTTNNQMELLAVIEGLEWLHLKGAKKVSIWTDSTYVIKGITSWILEWKKRDWKTASGSPVLNQSFWERLYDLSLQFSPRALSWNYVPGHQGIPGNERCDAIAVEFSKGSRPFLYEGPKEQYSVSLKTPENGDLPKPKPKKSSAPAKSYLSWLNGQVIRHLTWEACERRVKGRPGAKFKKSTHQLSEKEILTSWGLPPSTPIQEE